MTIETFQSLIQTVTQFINGRPLDKTLQAVLNERFPFGGADYNRIFETCKTAEQEGWMCQYEGGGVRYGLSLGRMVFLRRAHVQDSIAVEAGAFFYKIINFQSQGDSYSVLPLVGTVRYNVLFGENFGIFFYGGVVQNTVTQVSAGDPDVQASLQRVLPAAGGGLLFRVGPNWNARADLGYDMVGLGLTLRF